MRVKTSSQPKKQNIQPKKQRRDTTPSPETQQNPEHFPQNLHPTAKTTQKKQLAQHLAQQAKNIITTHQKNKWEKKTKNKKVSAPEKNKPETNKQVHSKKYHKSNTCMCADIITHTIEYIKKNQRRVNFK